MIMIIVDVVWYAGQFLSIRMEAFVPEIIIICSALCTE